jgi:biotin transport system substrate-specific component
LWARVAADRRAVAALGVATTVACLAIAAEVRVHVPFTPVPYTLQTFFVLLAGAALGPHLGTIALSSYLALGAVGLPIFTGQWLGPTTGYLVGFVAAGWLVGALTRRVERPTTLRIVLAMVLGDVVLLVLGAGWLAFGAGRGILPALEGGLVCFLPAEAVKIAAAAAISRGCGRQFRRLFPR